MITGLRISVNDLGRCHIHYLTPLPTGLGGLGQ